MIITRKQAIGITSYKEQERQRNGQLTLHSIGVLNSLSRSESSVQSRDMAATTMSTRSREDYRISLLCDEHEYKFIISIT